MSEVTRVHVVKLYFTQAEHFFLANCCRFPSFNLKRKVANGEFFNLNITGARIRWIKYMLDINLWLALILIGHMNSCAFSVFV